MGEQRAAHCDAGPTDHFRVRSSSYESGRWYGRLAPTGTPAAVLDLLNARVANIMQSSDMKARMTSDGLVPIGGSREQFAAHIRSEIAKWAKVISASGARVD